MTEQQEGWDKPLGEWRAIFFLAAAFSLCIGWLRDKNALVHAFDTGIYLQLFNSMASGSLESNLTGEANFMAHHFQPIILAFWPVAEWITRPFHLFLVNTVVTLGMLVLGFRKSKEPVQVFFIYLMLLHPGTLARIWYGFVPEFLSMLPLLWMAFILCQEPEEEGKSDATKPGLQIQWLIACILAGAGKETVWLTTAFASLGMMLKVPEKKWVYGIFFALNMAIFFYLFKSWMPENTSLTNYYGMSYYAGWEGFWEKPLETFTQVILTFENLKFLLFLFLMGCGFGLMPTHSLFLATIPVMAMILFASSGIVKHSLNHYLLNAMPFLCLNSYRYLKDSPWLIEKIRRYGSFYLLAIFSFSLFVGNGMAANFLNIVKEEKLGSYRKDVGEFLKEIPSDSLLVTNGSLQPLAQSHSRTIVFLGFSGNGRRLSQAEQTGELYFLLTAPVHKIPDCRKVQLGGPGLEVDYQYFYSLCELIKESGTVLKEYPDSKLVAYKVNG